MAYCFYNGVKLPELPSTAYSYAWIRKNDNTQYYDLILTKVVGYYDATAGGIVYGANQGTTEIAHYRIPYSSAATADGWDSYQTTNTWMALDASRTVMWSNHYIPKGSFTTTEMYFDGSEAIPDVEEYRIEKDTLVGIADQVRRVCDLETDLTPAEMEQNLRELNVNLMETFVVSGPVEQVIYPDEGCCGFSKVTVGAVDVSGGDGGGTSYPSAEDTTFGSESAEGEIPTGWTLYGTDKRRLPNPPAGLLAYQFVTYSTSGGARFFWSFSKCPRYTATHYFIEEETQYVRFTYDPRYHTGWTDVWSGTTASMNGGHGAPPAWANHMMINSDTGESLGVSSVKVAETTAVTVQTPLEREETYTISGSTLNDLGAIIQQITGVEASTPADMAAALNAYAGTTTG